LWSLPPRLLQREDPALICFWGEFAFPALLPPAGWGFNPVRILQSNLSKEYAVKTHTHALLVGSAVLAFAVGTLASGAGSAADAKGALGDIDKAAMEFQKGNADAGKKIAKELAAKYELDDLMGAFKLRTKGGLGYGAKAGEFIPDGIEAKFINLGKKAPNAAQLGKEADALSRAAYVSMVLGYIANDSAKTPLKKEGNKDPKDWTKWSKDMIEASEALAKAAKSKNGEEVKKAATSLNSSCNNCHGVFRD
jgi:hypothetical protein